MIASPVSDWAQQARAVAPRGRFQVVDCSGSPTWTVVEVIKWALISPTCVDNVDNDRIRRTSAKKAKPCTSRPQGPPTAIALLAAQMLVLLDLREAQGWPRSAHGRNRESSAVMERIASPNFAEVCVQSFASCSQDTPSQMSRHTESHRPPECRGPPLSPRQAQPYSALALSDRARG